MRKVVYRPVEHKDSKYSCDNQNISRSSTKHDANKSEEKEEDVTVSCVA